jgi:tetratricopeptide (TPR) repeat protein
LLAGAVVIAIVCRLAHLVNVYPTAAFSFHQTWAVTDMYKFDQWAERIVAGDALGREPFNPFLDYLVKRAPAGHWRQWLGESPVFYKAPLYAYLVALLRWLFGQAMLPLALLQILTSATSLLLIFLITERLFDALSAFLAALLFGVYAPAIYYDAIMLRGPFIAFTALLVTWQLMQLQSRPTPAAGCRVGLAVGLALLFNEGFLSVPLLVLVATAWWTRAARRCASVGGGFLMGLAIALLPLIVRNLIVGVPPLQLATTGATAWAIGNASDSDPIFYQASSQSFYGLMEASGGRLADVVWPCVRSFHSVGAFLLFYFRRATGLIVPYEGPDNANFYYAALKDPLLRWLPNYAVLFPLSVVGCACAGRRLRRFEPLLPMALSLLASIMLTLPLSRYRVTLAVFLFPLAGAALAQAVRWAQQRRFAALGAAVAALCLLYGMIALLQRRVVFDGRDPAYFLYRSAEFTEAAKIYTQQQRPREASQELLQLAQITPSWEERTKAWLQAARLQFQAGDTAAAQRSLETLARANGGDARTLLWVGDTYWKVMGDTTRALAIYQRAGGLRSDAAVAAALQARLNSLQPLGTSSQ